MTTERLDRAVIRLRRSRLDTEQTQRLLEHFVAGTPARVASELVGVNRNTATHFYHHLRELIAERMARINPLVAEPAGEMEVDAALFDSTGTIKRGQCASGRMPVFGLLRRGGKVYTAILPDSGPDTLLSVLRSAVDADSIVYTDKLDVRNALNVLGVRHQWVDHGGHTTGNHAHIGGIENFWSQTERHLRRYNGIPMQHFQLFLKECEWRFNYGPPKQLLATIKEWIGEKS